MKTLEQLLNSLVEAGWNPYGIPRVKNVVLLNHYISFSKRTILGIEFFEYTLRSLVSRESGLWQFVCENGMIKKQQEEKLIEIYDNLRGRTERVYDDSEYEYRLIESALKDESELESFILDNIKL